MSVPYKLLFITYLDQYKYKWGKNIIKSMFLQHSLEILNMGKFWRYLIWFSHQSQSSMACFLNLPLCLFTKHVKTVHCSTTHFHVTSSINFLSRHHTYYSYIAIHIQWSLMFLLEQSHDYHYVMSALYNRAFCKPSTDCTVKMCIHYYVFIDGYIKTICHLFLTRFTMK